MHDTRFRPSRESLKYIRHFNTSRKFSINRHSFRRLVCNMLHKQHGRTYRIELAAVDMLQTIAETLTSRFFYDAGFCAHLSSRLTTNLRDFHLARRIRGDDSLFIIH